MENSRFTNGDQTDRSSNGRFLPGCRPGPGNPNAAAVSKLRAKLYKVVKPQDVETAISTIRKVMLEGKDADKLTAAFKLFDRVIGPAVPADLLGEMAQLRADVNSLLGGEKR